MTFDKTFKSTVTGKGYYVKGELKCESKKVIYLITCMKCLEQYVHSVLNFKKIFRVHKSLVQTNIERYGTA